MPKILNSKTDTNNAVDSWGSWGIGEYRFPHATKIFINEQDINYDSTGKKTRAIGSIYFGIYNNELSHSSKKLIKEIYFYFVKDGQPIPAPQYITQPQIPDSYERHIIFLSEKEMQKYISLATASSKYIALIRHQSETIPGKLSLAYDRNRFFHKNEGTQINIATQTIDLSIPPAGRTYTYTRIGFIEKTKVGDQSQEKHTIRFHFIQLTKDQVMPPAETGNKPYLWNYYFPAETMSHFLTMLANNMLFTVNTEENFAKNEAIHLVHAQSRHAPYEVPMDKIEQQQTSDNLPRAKL